MVLCWGMASIHSIRAGRRGAGGWPYAPRAVALAAQPPAPGIPASPTPSNFTIFIRADAGRHRAGHGRAHRRRLDGSRAAAVSAPPVDIVTRRLEVRYDADWKPLELASRRPSAVRSSTIHTVVSGTTASERDKTDGTPGEKTDTIDSRGRAAAEPDLCARTRRLRRACARPPRARVIPVYVVPRSSRCRSRSGARRRSAIQTLARVIDARRTQDRDERRRARRPSTARSGATSPDGCCV